MARPVRPALGVLRGCTNPPGPTGLLRGGQSRSRSLLLEPWAHPGAAARAHSSCTAGATAPDLSSEPLCRPPFFPSLRPPLAKGAPARCKVLSRPGERHPRDGGEKPKSALHRSTSLPGGQTLRASPEYSRRGLSRRGPPEVRVGGAGPARPCEGGGGAVGCLGDAGHRVPAAPAAAAAAAAAASAARASRAGYINTRFHTPELTSAGPAQPRAGGARER